MIEFSLTPAQQVLRADARRFSREVLSGVADAIRHEPDPHRRFLATRPFYEALVEQGFMRRLIPQSFGGDSQGVLDMAVIAEEFYAVDPSVGLTALANVLGLSPVMIAGTVEQQQRFIAPFLQLHGAPLAGFASSEPGGSANFEQVAPAQGVRSRAVLENGEWRVNAHKQWISSASGWDGQGADILCVVCRTQPSDQPGAGLSVIAVPRPERGFVLEEVFDTVGHRGHLTPRFSLNDVRVSVQNLIGREGEGQALVEQSFGSTAALVGVLAGGLMRSAFDLTLDFCRRERRGGVLAIIEHQAVGYALADAKMAIEAVRSLAWRACWAQDAQSPGALELALHSKVYGSETAVRVITELMRVVGIESYSHALPMGALLQDALALPLFDGGNQGVRRRQLHSLLRTEQYDPLSTFN